MSSVDTKWKKKIKGINNKEGLENKAENSKTTRGEKDEAQTKILDELKNRLRNIKNKRNGFTKLPHLTDVKEESDIKEEFKEGQENDTDLGEQEESDEEEGNEDAADGANKKKFKLHGIILITSYVVFLIAYLQLYHLNFKESIESNFPDL